MASMSFGNADCSAQVAINNGTINFSPASAPLKISHQITDDEIHRSLAFPQMLDRKDNIERCHSNTCEWILDLDEYKSWMKSSHGLLWVKGKPGAGKSTLMAFLHDKLRKMQWQEQGQSEGSTIQINFFFTARGTKLQRTPLGMFRSLLNQIFNYDPAVRQQVHEVYEQRTRQFGLSGGTNNENNWEWPRAVLEELLADAILTSAARRNVRVFVDALDEAGSESAQQLASYFHRIIHRAGKVNASVHICISCRQYPILGNTRAMEICVEEHNQQDIAAYIVDILVEMEEEDDLSSSNRMTATLVKNLTRQANGVFQWAHLTVPLIQQRILEGESLSEINRWLQEVPEDLENVYQYILDNVIEPRNREQSLLLFQWVCFAERRLTVTEFRYALAAKNAAMRSSKPWEDIEGFVDSNERMKRKLKAISGGLVEVVQSTLGDEGAIKAETWGSLEAVPVVQTVHQSVNDFLRSKGLELLYRYTKNDGSVMSCEDIVFQSQSTLYRSCLAYLAMVEMPQDMPSRDEADEWYTFFRSRPFLTYATVNLFVHAGKSGNHLVRAVQDEIDILQEVINLWVEIYHLLDEGYGESPPKGTGLLHAAAAANLVDLIESLVSMGFNVNSKDIYRNTAFHSAARSGQIAAAGKLQQLGAKRDAKNGYGKTPLIEAAINGQVKFVEWFLKHSENTDAVDEHGSALQEASAEGQSDVVKILIGAGADVNAQVGGQYGNALQTAIYSQHTDIVRILLEASADVNLQGGYFGNALQAAAFVKNSEIVQMLLDHHADINLQGGFYGTALQAAAVSKNIKIVRMLITASADVNAQAGYYGTALQAGAFFRSFDIVRLLLDSDADVNVRGGSCDNALSAAAYIGNSDMLLLLLDAGADVNAQGDEYGSALQAAAAHDYENLSAIKILLKAHADVNQQGGKYGNALQAAKDKGHEAIIKVLLDAGAREV